MTVTVAKWTTNPKTQKKTMTSKEQPVSTLSDGLYFVVGRTNTGARYYSETVNSYADVHRIFNQYKDMIGYFGGGEIQIFYVHDKDYDVIESSRI